MKLRDNLTIFPVAVTGVGLEALIAAVYWKVRAAGGFNPDMFLLASQLYVLAACGLAYLASRLVHQPLGAVLEGIGRYGQGQFQHRIRRSSIRELDLLAEQLNRMAARLGELDTLKNDFIANVSHELRSPLAAMEEYVNLLLARDEIAGRSRENLERIKKNLIRLRDLVENLLSMSQIEAGRMPVTLERFSVAEAIKDVCGLFSLRIAARKLTLELGACEEVPEVHADRDKVKQILTNLVDNAVKYNRDGGRIDISVARGQGKLRLSVKDTGPGIAPEHLDSLFERFRRLPVTSPESAGVKGAGLGLAISRGLARAMGGDLAAESDLGAGSTFVLAIPLKEEADEKTEDPGRRRRG